MTLAESVSLGNTAEESYNLFFYVMAGFSTLGGFVLMPLHPLPIESAGAQPLPSKRTLSRSVAVKP